MKHSRRGVNILRRWAWRIRSCSKLWVEAFGTTPGNLLKRMVGLGGLEPPTSPLSGARSSHLSYRPVQLWQQLFLLYRTRQILAILLFLAWLPSGRVA
jgi:hypothetical protein